LKPESSQCDTGDDEAHCLSVVKIAEVLQPPLVHRKAQEQETKYKGGENSDQSSFEINNLEKTGPAVDPAVISLRQPRRIKRLQTRSVCASKVTPKAVIPGRATP
jgi:hypothetical protein